MEGFVFIRSINTAIHTKILGKGLTKLIIIPLDYRSTINGFNAKIAKRILKKMQKN